MLILQPDEMSSPAHPLLPPGMTLYLVKKPHNGSFAGAIREFLNSPHPLETLSSLKAYGSEGTISRDHHSNNYVKAVNGVLKQYNEYIIHEDQKWRSSVQQLLALPLPDSWSHRMVNGKRILTMEQYNEYIAQEERKQRSSTWQPLTLMLPDTWSNDLERQRRVMMAEQYHEYVIREEQKWGSPLWQSLTLPFPEIRVMTTKQDDENVSREEQQWRSLIWQRLTLSFLEAQTHGLESRKGVMTAGEQYEEYISQGEQQWRSQSWQPLTLPLPAARIHDLKSQKTVAAKEVMYVVVYVVERNFQIRLTEIYLVSYTSLVTSDRIYLNFQPHALGFIVVLSLVQSVSCTVDDIANEKAPFLVYMRSH